jgi:hypothetical protein
VELQRATPKILVPEGIEAKCLSSFRDQFFSVPRRGTSTVPVAVIEIVIGMNRAAWPYRNNAESERDGA